MPSLPGNEFDKNLIVHLRHQPSLEFAQLAQIIGYDAWSARMPDRPINQMRQMFNPDNQRNAENLLEKMNSKIGQFVGAVAVRNDEPIGYAWTHDDVGNMSLAQQKMKTLAKKLKGEKPYVWVAHINVLTRYQSKGYGSILLREILKPFDDDQKVSTYVFDENQITLNWFKKFGFSPRPEHPVDPNGKPDGPDIYFGEGADHVLQWRLEAQSNKSVRDSIENRTIWPPYSVVEVD